MSTIVLLMFTAGGNVCLQPNKTALFPSESLFNFRQGSGVRFASKVIINIRMIIPESVISSDEKEMEQLLISMMTGLDGNSESIHKKKLRQRAQVNSDINGCSSTPAWLL